MGTGASSTTKEVDEHHVVIFPDTCLTVGTFHNSKTMITVGYLGSLMKKTTLPNVIFPEIVNHFGQEHIVRYVDLFTKSQTDAAYEDSYVDIPTAEMILSYVPKELATRAYNWSISTSQLALLNLKPNFIKSDDRYWLRNMEYSDTVTLVVGVSGARSANSFNPDIASGVRPVFGLRST